MKTRGRHLIVEMWQCDFDLLNNVSVIEQLMLQAVKEAGATVVTHAFHPFAPQGVSGFVLIEESHFSIHTWPEHGYAALDFYTCGDCDPVLAFDVLKDGIKATSMEVIKIERGMLACPMEVAR